MLTTPVERPSAGLLASVLATTWLEQMTVGPVAFLLIGHPSVRRQNETEARIERQMRGLGEALGLSEIGGKVPDAGRRIWLRGQSGAALSLDGVPWNIQLPPVGSAWSRFVAAGGPVCIVVALDPIPTGVGQDVIASHLNGAVLCERALVGSAAVALECSAARSSGHPRRAPDAP